MPGGSALRFSTRWGRKPRELLPNRSFRLNFEIMAVVADHDFNIEVEQMLLADMEGSVEMQPGNLEEKSHWFELAVRLARLTAPVQ